MSSHACIIMNADKKPPRNLKPGGWFEMCEMAFPLCNDDGTASPDDPIHQWSKFMVDASFRNNQQLVNPHHYAQWMREAGFVNVQRAEFIWPINRWPRDKKLKMLGMWNQANMLDGLEGFTMGLFTRALGWRSEEVQAFLAGVRKDINNMRKHNYFRL